MARRRYISTEISIDRQVNELAVRYGDFAAILYTWMIPHTEDNCLISADPYELLNKVIPARRDRTESDIQQAVNGMVELKLINIITIDGKQMIRFPPESFYKYQSYIPERKRAVPQNADNHRQSPPISEEHRQSPTNAEERRYPNLTYPNLTLPIDVVVVEEKKHIGHIKQFWEENGLGTLKNYTCEEVGTYLDDGLEADAIIEVLKDSLTKRDPWAYAKSILNSCVERKILTLQQYTADKLEWEKVKQNKGVNKLENNSGDSKSNTKSNYDTSKILYKGAPEGFDPNAPVGF